MPTQNPGGLVLVAGTAAIALTAAIPIAATLAALCDVSAAFRTKDFFGRGKFLFGFHKTSVFKFLQSDGIPC